MRGYSLSFVIIREVDFLFKETNVCLFFPSYWDAFQMAQTLPDNVFRVQIRGVKR